MYFLGNHRIRKSLPKCYGYALSSVTRCTLSATRNACDACLLLNHFSSGMKYQLMIPDMVTTLNMTLACQIMYRYQYGALVDQTYEIEIASIDRKVEGGYQHL